MLSKAGIGGPDEPSQLRSLGGAAELLTECHTTTERESKNTNATRLTGGVGFSSSAAATSATNTSHLPFISKQSL